MMPKTKFVEIAFVFICVILISAWAGMQALSFPRTFMSGKQSFITVAAPPQSETERFKRIQYSDDAGEIGAEILLPDNLGEWALENPYRKATTSLTDDPKIYTKVYFQNVKTRDFHGILRVVEDLNGHACADVFAPLEKFTGLQIEKYTSTEIPGNDVAHLYVLQLASVDGKLAGGSKIVCDNKKAIEFLVLMPISDEEGDVITTILKNVSLWVPNAKVTP